MIDAVMTFLLIAGGFLLGSVPFSYHIPKLICGIDVCKMSDDGNAGAANAFIHAGIPIGMLCLLLDMAKGFIPVIFGCVTTDSRSVFFAAVMFAPVLGHALGMFRHWHGGKSIATSFGVLLGILPESGIVFLLAILYITFSTFVKINPHRLRSIVSYSAFAALGCPYLVYRAKYSIALGCLFISATVILKHAVSKRTEIAK